MTATIILLSLTTITPALAAYRLAQACSVARQEPHTGNARAALALAAMAATSSVTAIILASR